MTIFMHIIAKIFAVKNAKADARLALAFFILFLACARQKALVIHHQVPAVESWRAPAPPRRLAYRRVTREVQPLPLLSISAVGDLMMSSWIIDLVQSQGVDFPFDSTRALLKSTHLAIANLEAPLTEADSSYQDKQYTFKVPPEFVWGIKRAGIDAVTLANNHILDFGSQGLASTIATLDSAGIWHCGADSNRAAACEPTILDYFGVRIALLGFSMTFPKEFWATDTSWGTCYPHEALLAKVIRQSEEQADFTIVSFHWGAEKRTTPKEYQQYFAHLAIDLGADLVLGHHPHVLQGLEVYRNRLIAYSLGNYVFGSYSENARDSIVLQVMLTPRGLLYAVVHPISVYNARVSFQPRLLKGEERNRVLAYLNELSGPLNGDRSLIDAEGYIRPDRLFASPQNRIEDFTSSEEHAMPPVRRN